MAWRIVHKDWSVVEDIITQVGTLGTDRGSWTYTIEDEDTGERRTVTARDEEELGEKIADGDFDD